MLSKTHIYVVEHALSTSSKLFKVRSPSMSSYPAVGSALHLWVFFINDRITTLCLDQMTLLRPRGGLHWPGRDGEGKGRVVIRLWEADTMTISNALHNWNQWIWPEVINTLTQNSRNQSHDRCTCHSLCGKSPLICSTCLCLNRYL